MRTVKVYWLSAKDAAWWDNSWDYENPGAKGEGWYWDSWVDGREITVMDGPYSTERIARFAAGGDK